LALAALAGDAALRDGFGPGFRGEMPPCVRDCALRARLGMRVIAIHLISLTLSWREAPVEGRAIPMQQS
jgi:hypothetical protein